MWLISYCSLWLSLLSSWLVIWSVVHFVRAESRGRPRGQDCRASSPGWTPVEPAAHVDQSSWPWSWSSWKLWAKDLTEPTQASRLLVLLLLTTTPNSEIQFLAAGFFLAMFTVVLIVYSSFYPYCSISYGSSNEKASHLLGIFARFAFFAQSGGWKTNHHIGENSFWDTLLWTLPFWTPLDFFILEFEIIKAQKIKLFFKIE